MNWVALDHSKIMRLICGCALQAMGWSWLFAFLPDDPRVVEARQRWETAIQELEKRDAVEHYPDDAILLLGSSSIRMWETAATDLAPHAVIPRGYGGASFSDLSIFARRLISPHRFEAVVLFVANDVTGDRADHTPNQIKKWVRSILQEIRRHQPEALTLIVEITPTPARWQAWPKIRKVNELLREIALTEPNVYFVPTAEHYLDSRDQPIPDYFVNDMLHQNARGYCLWSALIRQRLEEVLEPELIETQK